MAKPKRNDTREELAAEWVDRTSLRPWGNNPRKNDHAVKAVAASIEELGFGAPIVARRENREVIAGHTRLKAAEALGIDRVPVRFVDLDERQAHMMALADNKLGEVAEWHNQPLADVLSDFSLSEAELLGWDGQELEKLSGLVDDFGPLEDSDDAYTRKVEVPIYEPKGERPPVSSLCNEAKTAELVDEISKADLPQDVADFLVTAAGRHTVFDYQAIAEFYAHADAATQDLMERSALVIVDFDKAIENGFVKLVGDLVKLAGQNEG